MKFSQKHSFSPIKVEQNIRPTHLFGPIEYYQNLKISWQKMGTFFENKVFFKYFFLKKFINKSWSPSLVFFKESFFLDKFNWFVTSKNDFGSTKLEFFVSWFPSFGKGYESDLRVIFHRWPKLHTRFYVECEIHISKGL